jgi:branched-subunit amino acid ABC-type transport system permease component
VTAFELQFLWNGLVQGSLLAVAALGLTTLFGILNFINIAYGSYFAFGAYIALSANISLGLPMWAAGPMGVVGAAVLSLVSDRVVFKKFRTRPPIILFIVSIGVAMILRNAIRVIWGTGSQNFDMPLRVAPQVMGVYILPEQVAILVISLLLLGGTYVLLRRTKLGISMRALSDDRELAKIRGLDTERIITHVWLITGAIAGLAGVLSAIDGNLTPIMGFTTIISVFAAVILGGVGNPFGAIIGGYTIGLAEEVSIIIIPSEYKLGVSLMIIIVVLLLKPEGIFGGTTR